mgnify:CR=1 FL=1
MGSTSPTSRALARRLLAKEVARGEKSLTEGGAASVPSAARVCDKLRKVLTTFAGNAGFRSLLTRALTLAAARAPELEGVTVMLDGSLSGIDRVESGKKKGAAQEWEEVLVAQLLDLLVTFVGEGLMHQLVRQAWPDRPAVQIRSRTEDRS